MSTGCFHRLQSTSNRVRWTWYLVFSMSAWWRLYIAAAAERIPVCRDSKPPPANFLVPPTALPLSAPSSCPQPDFCSPSDGYWLQYPIRLHRNNFSRAGRLAFLSAATEMMLLRPPLPNMYLGTAPQCGAWTLSQMAPPTRFGFPTAPGQSGCWTRCVLFPSSAEASWCHLRPCLLT